MQRLQCAQVWGGVRNEDVDIRTSCMTASLYSSSADGGKGGDIYFVSVCNHDQLTRVALASRSTGFGSSYCSAGMPCW